MQTFNGMFSSNNYYRIPNYQRGFAWQQSQVNDFWNDLESLDPNNEHYTGMITIQRPLKRNTSFGSDDDIWLPQENKPTVFHVIDGQQRITTFIIAIISMIHYADKHGITEIDGNSLESIRSKYICKEVDGLSLYKFGYEVDNPSFRYLKYRILDNNEIEEVGESYYTNNLANAKQFFDEKIEEACAGKGGKKKLDSLFKKLTEKMQFIEYVLNKGFDASVAFETMNNRGKKLTNLELLKNRLIYLTSLFDKEKATDGKKERVTSLINEKWGTVYKWLGHDKGSHLDDDEFLKNHWILYFGYKRQTGTDYVDFLLKKKFIPASINGSFSASSDDEAAEDVSSEETQEDSATDIREEKEKQQHVEPLTPKYIEDYVNDLALVSRLWYFSFHPESTECPFSPEEKNALLRLNRVRMAYFRPLVVASFARNDITKDERLVLFEAIERVILLVFRMARQMSSYQSSVYYNLAHDIARGDAKVSAAVYKLNKLFTDDIVSSVKTFKAKMAAAFVNDEGFYSWNSIRFLLFEYEANLCPSGDSSKALPALGLERLTKKIVIEYVMRS